MSDTDKTPEQLEAEAAAAEAEEAAFQKAQTDPAIVARAGIINGMDPAEIRRRILAAA